jgi:superfamily II DNA/RNA helicase
MFQKNQQFMASQKLVSMMTFNLACCSPSGKNSIFPQFVNYGCKKFYNIWSCRTKVDCDNLENYFNQVGGGARNRQNPFSCVCLHGDRKPQERKENLEKFKRNEVKFLIWCQFHKHFTCVTYRSVKKASAF